MPVFQDVPAALKTLKQSGVQLAAFSNGQAEKVELLLSNAGIRDNFDHIVSVDEIKTFKPIDILGAISCGMKAFWLQRNKDVVFDPWGLEPTAVIHELSEVTTLLG